MTDEMKHRQSQRSRRITRPTTCVRYLSDYKSPRFDYLPSFTGGLVGYFSYDYLGYSEPSVRMHAEDTEAFQGR